MRAILVGKDVIVMNNVTLFWVDETLTPFDLVIWFVDGREIRYAMNTAKAKKIANWLRNNPEVVELSDANGV